MRTYRAQVGDGRWLYPLTRFGNTYEGAEYHRPDPSGPAFLLAEDGAEIFIVSKGWPELIGWNRVSSASLYAALPEHITVAQWQDVIGEPSANDRGDWHDLIRLGIYAEVRGESQLERTPFDTSIYQDAPFDLTEIPEEDPHPDWQFQPNIAYAVFGPVYARLLPGAVLGLHARLLEAVAPLSGVSEAAIVGDRITGVLTLPYEDNRRIQAREGRARRTRLAVNKTWFKIPFTNHVAGESKDDAVWRAEQAIAEAVATLPVDMVTCAKCSGIGVVPSYMSAEQRRRHPPLRSDPSAP